MNFSENLARILDEKGISQRELAEKLECTDGSVSLYVNGHRKPNLDVLTKIADVLNVKIDELIRG